MTGARLHLGDLRIRDAQTNTPLMAEHRVELVELFDPAQQEPDLLSSSSAHPSAALASSLAISTISSSRLGRNSWSGGSIVRIVTGSPCIALKTP